MPSGRCYGRADLPLLPGWQATLPALAAALRPIHPHLIHTSPLQRCRLPAEALSQLLAVPVRTDPRLIELDFGDWDGADWDTLPGQALDQWAADPPGFAPPGGESGQALIERVAQFCHDLLHGGGCAVVVSHGGPLRLLGPMLRGEKPDLLRPAPKLGILELVNFT